MNDKFENKWPYYQSQKYNKDNLKNQIVKQEQQKRMKDNQSEIIEKSEKEGTMEWEKKNYEQIINDSRGINSKESQDTDTKNFIVDNFNEKVENELNKEVLTAKEEKQNKGEGKQKYIFNSLEKLYVIYQKKNEDK